MIKSLENQRSFFRSGKTRPLSFRLEQLRILKKVIEKSEDKIYQAIKKDFQKPEIESFFSETSLVIDEIDYAAGRLHKWMKPRGVHTPLLHFPGRSFIIPEPYGLSLIIGPWNYPFQLTMAPVIGAMAAGNCVLIKPSSVTIHTSQLMADLIAENFDPAYLDVIQISGARSQKLLLQKFDFIFYTGSAPVGRIIMEAAAKHLTPVVLELGGKSPCIADADIDIAKTARSIIWGKFFNDGQTCIAPDYILVNRKIKNKLTAEMKKALMKFYGNDPLNSPDLAKIINRQEYERLCRYLREGDIAAGGKRDPSSLRISPTLLDNVKIKGAVMREEIFGPVLPVLQYNKIEEAVDMINSMQKPLAMYLFTRDKKIQRRVLSETSSGGLCINDTLVHFASTSLPFGGVGESGMGKYHGRMSFEAFSHMKSVFRKNFLVEIALRYPPYRKFGKLMRFFIKLVRR